MIIADLKLVSVQETRETLAGATSKSSCVGEALVVLFEDSLAGEASHDHITACVIFPCERSCSRSSALLPPTQLPHPSGGLVPARHTIRMHLADFLGFAASGQPQLAAALSALPHLPPSASHCLLSGPERSGKTSLLFHAALSLARQGREVLVLCRRCADIT